MSENWHEEDNHHENGWQRNSEGENAHDDQKAASGVSVPPGGWMNVTDHEEKKKNSKGEAEGHLEEISLPNVEKGPVTDERRSGPKVDFGDDQRGDVQHDAADALLGVHGNSQKPYSGYPYDDEEEEIDLDRYEIARPEFFAHLAEPTFTVNVDKVSVNAACVRLFPDVDFVEIMVYREEKKVLLYPCDEDDYSAYQWSKVKNGRRYSRHRAGEEFVLMLCEMMDWNPDFRYQILGKRARAKGKKALSFDLNVYKCYEKVVTENGKRKNRSFMHMDSVGRFGPTYAESKRSLDIKKFGEYTVIKVNKKKARKHDQLAEEQQPEKMQEPDQAAVENQGQDINIQPEVKQDE